MKSSVRENTQATTPNKLFDLSGLHNLTHSRIDTALLNLNSNAQPEKKYKSCSTSLMLHAISPYQRLADLINPMNQAYITNGMLVLTELLGGDIHHIRSSDVINAICIFLKFKTQGENYHSRNGNGDTCLHDALTYCGAMWKDLTALLIQNGADVNQENNRYITAMALAIKYKLKITFHSQAGSNPLLKALDMVSYVLTKAPLQFASAMEVLSLYQVFNEHPEWINQIYLYKEKMSTLLHIAAKQDNLGNVLALLNYGANPDLLDGNELKPIHHAVKELMDENNDESDSFNERIKIIACLIMASLAYLLPNEDVTAAQVVNAILEVDLVNPVYREKVCSAVFTFYYTRPLAFSENELLALLHSELKVINRDEIIFDKKIAEGTFGKIYEAMEANEESIKMVAIKLNKHDGTHVMRTEANIHEKLRHPNLVKYLGALERNHHFGIVMEYADCGSLYDFIYKNNGNEIEIYMYTFAKQMIAGLGYMHGNGYVHLDFKPGNILLKSALVASGSIGFRLLIADFGTTAKQGETRSYDVTTYAYSSPERLDVKNPYLFANDIYSFAIVLAELDTRQPSWPDHTNKQFIKESVGKGLRPAFGGKQITPYVAALVNPCWQQSPNDRPDCPAIEEHLKKHFKFAYRRK